MNICREPYEEGAEIRCVVCRTPYQYATVRPVLVGKDGEGRYEPDATCDTCGLWYDLWERGAIDTADVLARDMAEFGEWVRWEMRRMDERAKPETA